MTAAFGKESTSSVQRCAFSQLLAPAGARDRRILLVGAPGVGKSTLAARLADQLLAAGRTCECISADPGSPAFGIPGAVSLARQGPEGWEPTALEPLCTLDAGRFRLPLAGAVRRLVARSTGGSLLIDSPGVVRGVAGSELLSALVEVAAVDLIVVVAPAGRPPPLASEISALGLEHCLVVAAEAARRPGRHARARARSLQWERYLAGGTEQVLALDRLILIGTPPPADEPAAWTGRQIALLRAGACEAMGIVVRLFGNRLTVRLPHPVSGAGTLLVRDARQDTDGLLATAEPFAATPMRYLPPNGLLPETASLQGPRPAGRIGGVDVALVNGLFGDPLLHLRLRHRPRSLMFDLGDGSRLSARVAHQVSHVFISHAHMDHLSGFIWLLRSRIGDYGTCQLCGPPGLAHNIQGLIRGFLWDRAGDRAPVFEVSELHGDTLQRYRLRAGEDGMTGLPTATVAAGVVHSEPGFRVRATTLDHHTPVLAYAFEPDREINVRKDGLSRLGLAPGPWLNELKGRFAGGDEDAGLALPDGRIAPIGALADQLLLVTPGKRLVYATDLADTAENRERLVALARNAHTLFLEATFAEKDSAQARIHGHLTARSCGEIAAAAGVARLIPFHFSRRYVACPGLLFDEIEAACSCVVRPGRQILTGSAAGDSRPVETPANDLRLY